MEEAEGAETATWAELEAGAWTVVWAWTAAKVWVAPAGTHDLDLTLVSHTLGKGS